MLDVLIHYVAGLWHVCAWLWAQSTLPMTFLMEHTVAGCRVLYAAWAVSAVTFTSLCTVWIFNNQPLRHDSDVQIPIMICMLGAVAAPFVLAICMGMLAMVAGLLVFLIPTLGVVAYLNWKVLRWNQRRKEKNRV